MPYELRYVDIAGGENRTAAFLAINPAGYVPALITPEGERLHAPDRYPAMSLWVLVASSMIHLMKVFCMAVGFRFAE